MGRGATPSPPLPRGRLSVTSRRSSATLPWTSSRRCPPLPPPPPWRSATLTSGRTCTPTPSCPEAPLCTPVLLTACRRRSPPWLPPPSRSRSSLPPRGSTPSGSEAPSWLPSPPSSRCGSPSRSTTSAAPPLSTASASKHLFSSVEEKQHTGSYHQHLHLRASGVLPSFLSNHISIACRLDFVPFHSTLFYIPSSILTLPLNKMSHFGTFVTSLTVYWHH